MRDRWHPTKSPPFQYMYTGIKALYWVMHSILGLVCTDCCKKFLDYLSTKVLKFYKRGGSYSLLGGRHVSWSPQRKWSQRHSPGSSKSSSNLQSLTFSPPDEAPASIVRDFGFWMDFWLLTFGHLQQWKPGGGQEGPGGWTFFCAFSAFSFLLEQFLFFLLSRPFW